MAIFDQVFKLSWKCSDKEHTAQPKLSALCQTYFIFTHCVSICVAGLKYARRKWISEFVTWNPFWGSWKKLGETKCFFWGWVDKKSDYSVEHVPDVRFVDVFLFLGNAAEEHVSLQDEGEVIVCGWKRVLWFCPFTTTDVSVSNFKPC